MITTNVHRHTVAHVPSTSLRKVDPSKDAALAVIGQASTGAISSTQITSVNSDPAEVNVAEAFAKMKVNLQSGNSSNTSQKVAGTLPNSSKVSDATDSAAAQSSASKDFSDYMHETPAEKMRQQMLGITKEQYDAMSPEQKMAIDQKVAKLIKEKMETQVQVAKKSLDVEKAAS